MSTTSLWANICNHIFRKDVQPEVSEENVDHILQQWPKCISLVLLAVIHFPGLSCIFMIRQTSYRLMLFSALSEFFFVSPCEENWILLSKRVHSCQLGLCNIWPSHSSELILNFVSEIFFLSLKNNEIVTLRNDAGLGFKEQHIFVKVLRGKDSDWCLRFGPQTSSKRWTLLPKLTGTNLYFKL